MKDKIPQRIVKSSLVLFAIGMLPSCSTPPSVAWRNFTHKVASVFNPELRGSNMENYRLDDGTAESRYAAASNRYVQPVSAPMAIPVPQMPGYVRTPFTSPARLVDVSDYQPGMRVRCPFTHNVFIVPGANRPPMSPTGPQLVAESRSETNRISDSSNLVGPTRTELNNRPELPETDTTTFPELTDSGSTLSVPVPVPDRSSTPDPVEKPYDPANPPTANRIDGRPGFVNSPFAGVHQLVDVTGLPAGSKVRCPYSGKIFLTPGEKPAPKGPATVESDPKADAPKKEEKPTPTEEPETPKVEKEKKPSSTTTESRRGKAIVATLDEAKLSRSFTASSVTASFTDSVPAAKWAPDREGFVISPHVPGALIDVTGKEAGSTVTCPFSGQQFLVREGS